jgi:hypothetical protein
LWELVVLAQLQLRVVPQVQAAAWEAVIPHMKSTHLVEAVAVQAQDLPLALVPEPREVAVVAVDLTLSPELVALHQHKPTPLVMQRTLLAPAVVQTESPRTVHPVAAVVLLLLVLLAQPVQVAQVVQVDLAGASHTQAVEVAAAQSQRLQVLVDQVLEQQVAALAPATTHSPTLAVVVVVQVQPAHPTKAATAATDSLLSAILACPSHPAAWSPTQAATPTTTSTQRTLTMS